MIEQTNATIYLSDQRRCTQTETFRSFHTFNFGSFFDENKKPFANLLAFNEDTLMPNSCVTHTVDAQTTVIILPIHGTVEVFNDFNTEGVYVGIGEAYFFTTVDEEFLKVINPYDSDIVSYLQIHLQNVDFQPFNKEKITAFDFIPAPNQLLPFFLDEDKNQNTLGYIGQYEGRKESIYTLKNPKNSVFVFVIEGVFEVQNRLLHARDGLSLSEIDVLELEALSNVAVILLLELPFENVRTK